MKMGPNDGLAVVWAIGTGSKFSFFFFHLFFLLTIVFVHLYVLLAKYPREKVAAVKMGPNDS